MKKLTIEELWNRSQVRNRAASKARDQVSLQTMRQTSDKVWAYVQNRVWNHPHSTAKIVIIRNLNEKI